MQEFQCNFGPLEGSLSAASDWTEVANPGAVATAMSEAEAQQPTQSGSPLAASKA